MDFLRTAFFYKGNVLFVEDDDIGLNPKFAEFILRQSLLLCMANFLKLSVYEVWTFINSQVLFLNLPYSHIALMSRLMIHQTKLTEVTLDLKRTLNNKNRLSKCFHKSNAIVDVAQLF